MRMRITLMLATSLCAIVLAAAPTHALEPYDVPVVSCGDASLASITLNV